MKFNFQVAFILLITFVFSSTAQVSDRENSAREWISNHSRELAVKPFHTFKLNFVRKSLSGETLRFQHMINDVPVFGSEIVIHYSPNDEITSTSNTYDATVENILTTPVLSKENAINASNTALKVTAAISYQDCKLYVYNKLNQTRLIYRVLTDTENINGSWEAIVDAQTGEVISLKDVAKYYGEKPKKKSKDKEAQKGNMVAAPAFVSGTGMIFNPDPISVAQTTYTGSYVDNNDATNSFLDAARSSVELPELEFASNLYKLKGTYAEIKNLANPNKGLFTQATNVFNFTRYDDGFEAVNAYYHIDKSLRYINTTLGIVCKPLTNSGVLWFDPSAENGADNSHYSNGQLHFGEGGVDDAEDADVILHELGHGLHDWMTNGSLSQVDGLSEGCGDYWAQSYSRSLNQWAATNAAYQKVFNWDGPAWSSTRNTNYSPNYPSGLVSQIHTDGQIWSTALMKIWDAIGKTKTDKAFLEGLSLTNSSSSQQDAAIAFRQAAIDMNYPCADITTITTKFTSKGYTLPALTLSMAAIANQTVAADAATNTYTLPNYATLANPISEACAATLSQSPNIGSILAPGVYTITMTATLGTATVIRTFQLTVTDVLGIDKNVKPTMVIYPNPAKNQITIKGEFDTNESITIFNLLGQKVIERNSISNEERIDVSKLESGVYTIYFNASKASYKFVKE